MADTARPVEERVDLLASDDPREKVDQLDRWVGDDMPETSGALSPLESPDRRLVTPVDIRGLRANERTGEVVQPKEAPATLASVAASAGVSIATVSKVLHGRADVGPTTRARVQTLLQEHEYVGRRAESARRTLAAQPTVELVFHGRLSSYSMEILQGVLDAGPMSA